MKVKTINIIQIIVVLVLVYIIYRIGFSGESLCVSKSYGIVTDIPVSTLANANMGLVNDSSLGQAPLGDPRYWIKPTSPITQGQYGLYLETPPLSEVANFDPQELEKVAAVRQVYTTPQMSGQCTRLN